MACMCGDYCCWSCGPAQGNWRCPICNEWASEGCEHISDDDTLPLGVKPEFRVEAEAAMKCERDAEEQMARDYDEDNSPDPELDDDYDYDDDDRSMFADPGGTSALRAASKTNPRNLPCPTCKKKNKLTPKDRALGYQCDTCADALERGIDPY